MDKKEIEETLIVLLRELQAIAGDEPTEVTPATTPLEDLPNFDSLLGLEMTVAVEERLGITCEEQTIFKDEETLKALSISEISERIAEKHSGGAQ